MAEYIYTNKAGIELRREPKGRGKPKSGSIKKEDGNFYVIETVEKPQEVKTVEKTQEPTTETAEVEEKETTGIIKTRKTAYKVKLEDFIRSFHYSPQDINRTDEKIAITKCIQQYKLFDDITLFNSPYAGMEICLKTGVISVWITNYISKPNFVVNNCIILPQEKK